MYKRQVLRERLQSGALGKDAYYRQLLRLVYRLIFLLVAEDRDLLLSPDQMMLQIHESIGHPLELDRILGDERNFAGTSFVTPDMFGSYRYGSALLDVGFDPGVPGEVGSYAVDDDGAVAQPVRLIEKGVLQRALGGDRLARIHPQVAAVVLHHRRMGIGDVIA